MKLKNIIEKQEIGGTKQSLQKQEQQEKKLKLKAFFDVLMKK
jgi:hypothetical protein